MLTEFRARRQSWSPNWELIILLIVYIGAVVWGLSALGHHLHHPH